MGDLLRRYWHPIAAVAELEHEPVRAVELLGEEPVLYRDRQGTYGLLGRHCPHRRADLSYGWVEDRGLRCGCHGWITSHVMNQDFVAWVGQGTVTDRDQEHLGRSDRGVALMRRRLREEAEAAAGGADPKGLVRDAERNACMTLPIVGRAPLVEARASRRRAARWRAPPSASAARSPSSPASPRRCARPTRRRWVCERPRGRPRAEVGRALRARALRARATRGPAPGPVTAGAPVPQVS